MSCQRGPVPFCLWRSCRTAVDPEGPAHALAGRRFRGWTGEMPHRGWRDGQGGLESLDVHLSAERLADLVGGLRVTSSDSAAMRAVRGTPQKPWVTGSTRASVRRVKKAAKPDPAVAAPDVPRSARRVFVDPASGVPSRGTSPTATSTTAASTTAARLKKGPVPMAAATGRHRRQPSPKIVWGFAPTSYRLVLMGVLAVLVAAAAVLKSMS